MNAWFFSMSRSLTPSDPSWSTSPVHCGSSAAGCACGGGCALSDLDELPSLPNILEKLSPDDLAYLPRPLTFLASWAAPASSASENPIMQESPANVWKYGLSS